MIIQKTINGRISSVYIADNNSKVKEVVSMPETKINNELILKCMRDSIQNNLNKITLLHDEISNLEKEIKKITEEIQKITNEGIKK